MTWTNTNDAFSSVGGIMVRSLREELKFQKHRATGALSRGLKKSKMFFEMSQRLGAFQAVVPIVWPILTLLKMKVWCKMHKIWAYIYPSV